MAHEAEVRNAADPQQVRRAGRRDRDRHARELEWVRAVLAHGDGRAMVWTLLERAGIFRSVWHTSAMIHYNAGRQDFGHELMALVIEADEEGFELMQREARTRARRERLENEAAHTPRQGGTNGGSE